MPTQEKMKWKKKWNQDATNFLSFYNEWLIYEIKIVIINMKTKILSTEVAKRTRINIQICIKIIVAKIQTRSWPKLDRDTLFVSTSKIGEFFLYVEFCNTGYIHPKHEWNIISPSVRNNCPMSFFAFHSALLCLTQIMSIKPVFFRIH